MPCYEPSDEERYRPKTKDEVAEYNAKQLSFQIEDNNKLKKELAQIKSKLEEKEFIEFCENPTANSKFIGREESRECEESKDASLSYRNGILKDRNEVLDKQLKIYEDCLCTAETLLLKIIDANFGDPKLLFNQKEQEALRAIEEKHRIHRNEDRDEAIRILTSCLQELESNAFLIEKMGGQTEDSRIQRQINAVRNRMKEIASMSDSELATNKFDYNLFDTNFITQIQ